jgi:hypothetical protein
LLRLKDVLKNTLTFVKNGEKDNINPHILIGEVVLVLEDAVSRIDTLKQG